MAGHDRWQEQAARPKGYVPKVFPDWLSRGISWVEAAALWRLRSTNIFGVIGLVAESSPTVLGPTVLFSLAGPGPPPTVVLGEQYCAKHDGCKEPLARCGNRREVPRHKARI